MCLFVLATLELCFFFFLSNLITDASDEDLKLRNNETFNEVCNFSFYISFCFHYLILDLCL